MPSFIGKNIVLDGMVNKLQCSTFYMKRAMNRVPLCVITSILSLKWHLSVVSNLLVELF